MPALEDPRLSRTTDSKVGNRPVDAASSSDAVLPVRATEERQKNSTRYKWLFALQYMLQGAANPFQGLTHQPIYRHLHVDYGLTASAAQNVFAQSYLVWSLKPLIGFLVDAHGRTRSLLVVLLGVGALGYWVASWLDAGPQSFIWLMLGLSLVFAATDVVVDRATVIEGAEEAASTGRSRANVVGLNQAICWLSIYGSGAVAAGVGGWAAENVRIQALLPLVGLLPLLVLGAAWSLPKDDFSPAPLRDSIKRFWVALNQGPVLNVMAFAFVFNFQPAMGAIWNDHLLTDLHFSHSEVGLATSVGHIGFLLGVGLFVWRGTEWQARVGLRGIFSIFIPVSMLLALSQLLLTDPYFSILSSALAQLIPAADAQRVRLTLLCLYNVAAGIPGTLIRMSALSLLGAVIPVSSAGSMFAAFMSVGNAASSMSLKSGSWLYEHGVDYAFLRTLQSEIVASSGQHGDVMCVRFLVIVNAAAFVLSFAFLSALPDRNATLSHDDPASTGAWAEQWNAVSTRVRRGANAATLVLGLALAGLLVVRWNVDLISAVLASFLGVSVVRKASLDAFQRFRLR